MSDTGEPERWPMALNADSPFGAFVRRVGEFEMGYSESAWLSWCERATDRVRNLSDSNGWAVLPPSGLIELLIWWCREMEEGRSVRLDIRPSSRFRKGDESVVMRATNPKANLGFAVTAKSQRLEISYWNCPNERLSEGMRVWIQRVLDHLNGER